MRVFAGLLIYLGAAVPVHAYLDPGTGSYVFQLLIAGILGSTFFLKTAIKKILKKFTKNSPRTEDDAS